MKKFTIEEDVFKTEPLVLYDCTHDQVISYLKKQYRIYLSEREQNIIIGGAATVLTFNKSPWRLMWFRKLNKSVDSLGEVSHEVFHLVVRICEDKGIPIKSNIETGECGDEAAAYMMDFFFRQIYKRL